MIGPNSATTFRMSRYLSKLERLLLMENEPKSLLLLPHILRHRSLCLSISGSLPSSSLSYFDTAILKILCIFQREFSLKFNIRTIMKII